MKAIPQSKLRKIRTWTQGEGPSELKESDNHHSLIDLASNDYLGLNRHKNLIEAAYVAMKSQGVGAGGSRLVTGNRPIHQELESELSNWLNRESTLLFPSGFQANIAAIVALADRHTTVIADKLIHHSLLVGIKASGAKLKRFAHNNIEDLERILHQAKSSNPTHRPLVVTESLFSMEGTSPAIDKISKLCEKHESNLLVDEAHALGVMGNQGRGLSYGINGPLKIISGTLGKAFGCGGAFLVTDNLLREQLIQTSGALRYTTALAPPLAAAGLEALRLIKSHPTWCKNLQEESTRWRSKLKENGWSLPHGNGPIISLVIGSAKETLEKQNQLEKDGLLSIAIRPPTVPEGTSRLRIVVRRGLPENTLDNLITSLATK